MSLCLWFTPPTLSFLHFISDAEALFHELKGDGNVGTTDSTKDIWDSWLSLAGEEKPPDSAATKPAVNGTAQKHLEATLPVRSKDVGGEKPPVPEERPEDEDAMGGWPSFLMEEDDHCWVAPGIPTTSNKPTEPTYDYPGLVNNGS